MKHCRVLFVCTGNICRSPLAEAVFREQARAAGALDRFEIDSAGTHGWHQGEQADPRAQAVGRRHGAEVTSRARRVQADDFARFDIMLAMDRGHLRELRERCPPDARARLHLMREFDEHPGNGAEMDVPDPYYDGIQAFEQVYAILEPSCRRLLAELRK